ncbi:MAG: hypothetical protein IJ689_00330 [Alphaproteobacteria bacterium]|nr:hypothetical protein [Alphaproteobacteria bacterium]
MTNKTFLILLLTGISYTAYNAAAVSENFAISTTIDHEITLGSFRTASMDVDFDVTRDINIGTIVINKNLNSGSLYRLDCNDTLETRGGIVEVRNESMGLFSTNVDLGEEWWRLSLGEAECSGLIDMGGFSACFIFSKIADNNYAVCTGGLFYSSPPSTGTYQSSITVTYLSDWE